MSTKIFNGYKLHDDLRDMCELNSFMIGNVKNQVRDRMIGKYSSVLTQMAVNYIDRHSLGLNVLTEKEAEVVAIRKGELTPLLAATTAMFKIQEEVKTSRLRNPEFDFSCNVVVLPQLGRRRPLLALFYSEQKEYVQAWEHYRQVTEYSYWNNTDRPEGITEDDWNVRAENWDGVLQHDSSGIPGLCGLNYDFICDHYPMVCADVATQYVPQLAERAKGHIDNRLFDYYLKEVEGEDEDSGPAAKMFQMYRRFKDWRDEEDHLIEDEITQEVLDGLKAGINKDDLLANLDFVVKADD